MLAMVYRNWQKRVYFQVKKVLCSNYVSFKNILKSKSTVSWSLEPCVARIYTKVKLRCVTFFLPFPCYCKIFGINFAQKLFCLLIFCQRQYWLFLDLFTLTAVKTLLFLLALTPTIESASEFWQSWQLQWRQILKSRKSRRIQKCQKEE